MTSTDAPRLVENCPQAAPSPSGEACPTAECPEQDSDQDSLTGADELNVFSYFRKPITNTNPMAKVGLHLVYNLIKDDVFKKPTHVLRLIEDEEKARSYKSTHFDYCTFSGVFSRRDSKCLKEHSGLLCLDFDHLDDPKALKLALLADKFFETQLAFISPSGNGLKWIIPIEVSPLVTHEKWFTAVRNYIEQAYKVNVDPPGRDVARACFLPHDPEAYLNPKLFL